MYSEDCKRKGYLFFFKHKRKLTTIEGLKLINNIFIWLDVSFSYNYFFFSMLQH